MSKLQEYQAQLEKSRKLYKDNCLTIEILEKQISEVDNEIETARQQRSLARVKDTTAKKENLQKDLRLAREVDLDFKRGMISIDPKELQAEFSQAYTMPFNERWTELLAELEAKKKDYIDSIKAAYKELNELEDSLNYRDWSEISSNNEFDCMLFSNSIRRGDWNSLTKFRDVEIYY